MVKDRTLHVDDRPLIGLIPFARNSRTHFVDQVAASKPGALWRGGT